MNTVLVVSDDHKNKIVKNTTDFCNGGKYKEMRDNKYCINRSYTEDLCKS